MEDNNKKDGMGNCSCNWGGNHHVSLFRIIIFLVFLGFVFSFGMKFGELKASIEGQYGEGQYGEGQYGGGQYDYGLGHPCPPGYYCTVDRNYGDGKMHALPIQGNIDQAPYQIAK